MNKFTKIIGAFALAALVGTLALTVAQSRRGQNGVPPQDGPGGFGGPGGPGMGHRPPGPPDGLNPRMLEQLDLSDTQREQIRTLHEGARTESEKYGAQMKDNRDQIEALVKGGAFDEAQARKLLATKAALMTEMELIHLKTDAAVYALLTTEQRAKLEQFKQDRPPFPPPFRGDRPADGK